MECMRDTEKLEERLDRPVNRIGSTAREYGKGDTESALHRGPFDTGKQIMRKMHGLEPEPKEHKVMFGTLHSDGSLTDVRHIKQSDMLKCPHAVMVPEHYRDDGTCKCDDPEHRQEVMIKKWGYRARDFKKIPLRVA